METIILKIIIILLHFMTSASTISASLKRHQRFTSFSAAESLEEATLGGGKASHHLLNAGLQPYGLNSSLN
jgi:hypothetical protein